MSISLLVSQGGLCVRYSRSLYKYHVPDYTIKIPVHVSTIALKSAHFPNWPTRLYDFAAPFDGRKELENICASNTASRQLFHYVSSSAKPCAFYSIGTNSGKGNKGSSETQLVRPIHYEHLCKAKSRCGSPPNCIRRRWYEKKIVILETCLGTTSVYNELKTLRKTVSKLGIPENAARKLMILMLRMMRSGSLGIIVRFRGCGDGQWLW